MEERNAVRNILKAKLPKEQFEIFQNEDMERLGANGFTIVEAFKSADRDLFKMALPRRAGLVGILLKAFETLQPPADPFHFRPFPATEDPEYLKDPVPALITHFGERVREARTKSSCSTERTKETALPLATEYLDSDVGQYFPMKCRRVSLVVVFMAVASIFNTFLQTSGQYSNWCRNVFFIMMVAYPGSGKTTFGSLLQQEMKHYWSTDRNCVLGLLDRSPPKFTHLFMTMLTNSLNYDLGMKHTLHNESGNVLRDEEELYPAQLLALRCLHSSFGKDSKRDYANFLHELHTNFPGLKNVLTIEDVVATIRGALRIPSEQRILMLLFMDEVQAAVGKNNRTTNNSEERRGNVTWFQQMMSEYVHYLFSARGGSTLLLMSAATTRFSAADLRFTEIGSSKSVLVPMAPLDKQAMIEIVCQFQKRLQITLGQQSDPGIQPPDYLMKILALTGGMPRLVSCALTALVTGIESAYVTPDLMLQALSRSKICQADMKRILWNLDHIVTGRLAFVGYNDPKKFKVLERAFAHAILQIIVRRGDCVLDNIQDTWGDLEAQGMIALDDYSAVDVDDYSAVDVDDYSAGDEPPSKRSRVQIKASGKVVVSKQYTEVSGDSTRVVWGSTFAECEAHVRFCPYLLKYLVNNQEREYAILWPDLMSTNWKIKEEADVLLLLFKLKLLRQCIGRSTFTLKELLPKKVSIPDSITDLVLVLPTSFDLPKRYNQEQKNDCSGGWAFIGTTNSGFDSVLLFEVGDGRLIHLIIESKLRVKPTKVAKVNYQSIRQKQEHVCSSYCWNRESSSVVFLYISDEQLPVRQRQVMEKDEREDAQRLIVWDAFTDEDESPVHVLSALKHFKYLSSP